MSTKKPGRRWMFVAITALVVNTLLATAVIASHTFSDVPDTHTFHDDITWLSNNDITRGCNPPANTMYCPGNNLTRGEMAALMHRFADTFGWADAVAQEDIHIASNSTAEVLSINVTPKHQAQVLLNANAVFHKTGDSANAASNFLLTIRRDSCTGPTVGNTARWRTYEIDGPINTLSVTALDTVSEPTTYKVCASVAALTGFVRHRAATAVWMPTG